MLFWGIASRDLNEVIDFFDSPEQAARTLRDVLSDEPDWRDELCVVAVEFSGPAAAARLSLN